MDHILLHSQIVIDHLHSGKGVLEELQNNFKLYISAASYTHILAIKLKDGNHSAVQESIKQFVEEKLTILPFTENIAVLAAEILVNQPLTLHDAIVAATAIEHKYPLLVPDSKHFDDIPELVLVDV